MKRTEQFFKKINDFEEDKINALYIISVAFLFPLIALINYSFEIQNGIISQGFRLFNVIFSIYILYKAKPFDIKTQSLLSIKNTSIFLFLLFWIFYLTRLVVDLEHNELHLLTLKPKKYYYLYTFGVTILPFLVSLFIKKIDFEFLERNLHRYLIFLNCSFLVIFIIDKFFSNHLTGRFEITRNGFDYLDAITVSVYAGLLIIISFLRIKINKLNYLYLFLGCFIIFSTASRGSILFTLVTLLFLILFKKNSIKINYFYLSLLVLICGILNYIISLFFKNKNNFQGQNILLHRITNFQSEDSTISRIKILKGALNQILDQPIFGSHFIVIESKMYAHNILLDILIATGVIGLVLITPSFLIFAKRIFSKTANQFLISLGVFFFLNTLTSGACYNMTEFWIIFTIIILYKTPNKYNNLAD